MQPYTTVNLTRDVSATQIPSGEVIQLPIGTQVYITQTLGGTITVATDHGLARLSRQDADALGMEDTSSVSIHSLDENASLEDRVWQALKSVYDPEIPVDIVNLGLVYDCVLTETEDKLFDVVIKMTLTAPGCGMGPAIAADAEGRVASLPGVASAIVELVWDPAWTQDMVSEEGRMILGIA